MTVSKGFSWMHGFVLSFEFLWSLFLVICPIVTNFIMKNTFLSITFLQPGTLTCPNPFSQPTYQVFLTFNGPIWCEHGLYHKLVLVPFMGVVDERLKHHCQQKGTSFKSLAPGRLELNFDKRSSNYCQTSSIKCTKSKNLNVSHLILQLSLPNP